MAAADIREVHCKGMVKMAGIGRPDVARRDAHGRQFPVPVQTQIDDDRPSVGVLPTERAEGHTQRTRSMMPTPRSPACAEPVPALAAHGQRPSPSAQPTCLPMSPAADTMPQRHAEPRLRGFGAP